MTLAVNWLISINIPEVISSYALFIEALSLSVTYLLHVEGAFLESTFNFVASLIVSLSLTNGLTANITSNVLCHISN